MDTFRHDLNRLFEDFFGGEGVLEPFRGIGGWSPALDVSETDAEVRVSAELPGMTKDDVQISLVGDRLTIQGEKKSEKETKGEHFYRMERSSGSFQRSLRLPAAVDADKVDAVYKDGILTITLPKTEKAQAKSIPISESD
jgi:HSP20 family protein